MSSTMEGCQNAAIHLSTQVVKGEGLISRMDVNIERTEATVNCPILEHKGLGEKTGRLSATPKAAVESLGEEMELTACRNCPISSMDMLQSAKYLSQVAIERAAIAELIERGDLPEGWLK